MLLFFIGTETIVIDVGQTDIESTTERPIYESTTTKPIYIPPSMTQTTITTESDIDYIDDTIEIEASPLPPADCGGRLFISHKDDCTKYYLCNFGKISEQSCPPGLYWNEDRCDWPENTKCNTTQRQVRIANVNKSL